MSILNVITANSCASDNSGWVSWRERLVQAELKHLLSLWSYSTQNFLATRKKWLLLLLWASHTAPTHIFITCIQPPQWVLVPCYLKHQQTAANTTCYSLGFLVSHPKISPQSCQLALLLLPRKISATARVWPVFPTAIWSQRLSRLSSARHESLTCNSAKTRSPHPLLTAALWVFPRAVMRNVKQTPLIKGMFV